MIRPLLLLALTALCAACAHQATSPDTSAKATAASAPAQLRIATYNTSLYSDQAGGLVRELQGDSAHARKIAAVLQRVRPDLVLLNEFDFDPEHRAADLFQQRYLQVAQPGGGEALRYPYRYLAPVNTGVPSGLDLDNNGSVGGDGRTRGNDAWGYGLHPGQYGMLVLSRYPIDTQAVRSFQLLKWSALPGALRPTDPSSKQAFYRDAIWAQLRLSSNRIGTCRCARRSVWCTRWSRTPPRRCSMAPRSATSPATTTSCGYGASIWTIPRTPAGCATTKAAAAGCPPMRASSFSATSITTRSTAPAGTMQSAP